MIKELFQKIFAKADADQAVPEVVDVADALRRLIADEDFQIFRAYIRAHYCQRVKALAIAPGDAVDLLRGQMAAFDQIFWDTTEAGVEQMVANAENADALARMLTAAASANQE